MAAVLEPEQIIVGHEVHHAPANQTFLQKYLLSTDHKQVGINYMTTALIFFVVGGILAELMRVNLATPGSKFIDPTTYNEFYTMHGTTMVFLFAVPFMVGGFTNFVMPLMIGAPDVAFPRLNMLSYVLFPPGGLLLMSSFLYGAPQAGWTSYPPVSLQGPVGQSLWSLAIIVLGISSTLSAINFLVTIVNMRTRGMTLTRLPLFVWSVLATSAMVLVATPALAGGVGVLFLARTFDVPFFNVSKGGQVVLWQHMFWFYSHPAVYIMILPGFGLISEIIAVFSRRPIFGYTAIAFSSAAIALISMLVWAHHMFTSGIQPALQLYFMLATMIIAVPTGIKIFSWLGTMYQGNLRLTTPMLFALGFICTFVIGGVTGIMLASVPVDYHEHATYFLVAHLHYVLFGGSVFTIFAGLYYWWPKITGRMMNERLGKWHFWLMFISANATFFPMHALGLLGMSRRIATYAPEYAGTNLFISIASFVLAASFLIFIYNAITSLRSGPKAPPNPWGARTLDWSTESPPAPHGNFYTQPYVTTHPYDFTAPAPYFGKPQPEVELTPLDERELRRKGFRRVT
ncbi:MAG TPA: cytochrome c oxidase subunit I [Chloroflexota bacterium]|nr:cytochrome c oxidase subunit I [Chloroflexota bacterium]